MQIITKMGSGIILKNKKFCRDQKQFFFYRDQNLNEAYLQERVQYLSLHCIVTKQYENCESNKNNPRTHTLNNVGDFYVSIVSHPKTSFY